MTKAQEAAVIQAIKDRGSIVTSSEALSKRVLIHVVEYDGYRWRVVYVRSKASNGVHKPAKIRTVLRKMPIGQEEEKS